MAATVATMGTVYSTEITVSIVFLCRHDILEEARPMEQAHRPVVVTERAAEAAREHRKTPGHE